MAEASYPEDLKYHEEHDWARVEGEEATFGIIWYAQDALGDSPERINDDPYGDGWLVRVRLSDPSEAESLMDADAYEKLLQSGS